MALVMIPCDLPWWAKVNAQLDRAAEAKTSTELVNAMKNLHNMCNISLDPEDDVRDPNLFDGLRNFIDKDLSFEERENLFNKTIPNIVKQAKALKSNKPPQGLHFNLQQEDDTVEYSYAFVASLIANAFFSTYPKRTSKTHPTLKDFNFTNFFKHLHLRSQKAKLRSILHYFDYLATDEAWNGQLVISRQVMRYRQWLMIEDWLECDASLCPLLIRHEGKLERAELECKPHAGRPALTCFSSKNFGDGFLDGLASQQSIQIATHPELLALILFVEALEDNEALIVEGLRHLSRIHDPKQRANFEAIAKPNVVTMCCMDAEDFSVLPLAQYEEDNILRELNKSMVGFRQRTPATVLSSTSPRESDNNRLAINVARRLSPIGENSLSSASSEADETNRFNCTIVGSKTGGNRGSTINILENGKPLGKDRWVKNAVNASKALPNNRFIVLGSSGEQLPVNRTCASQASMYTSCSSHSSDSYHSAKENVDEDENTPPLSTERERKPAVDKYNAQLDTPERRGNFAERLKEALGRESSACTNTEDSYTPDSDSSTDSSSYAVGIDVAGSQVADKEITLKRGGSRGFVLEDDDDKIDDNLSNKSSEAEQKLLSRFRESFANKLRRKQTDDSSDYSFSVDFDSEFGSEVEEVYEQLSRWLDEPANCNSDENDQDPRDKAVIKFASSVLKRALSESFAGVPVQEGEPLPFNAQDWQQNHKVALAVRSLSLELARQKSRRQPSIGNGCSTVALMNTLNNNSNEREEVEEIFDDTRNDEDDRKFLAMKCKKQTHQRKCMAINFTSQVFQTIFEAETTLSFPRDINQGVITAEKVSRENSIQEGGVLTVATGNWGCGSRQGGDPQLKLVVQWLAASMIGLPKLIYYTCGHSSLCKLDTVSRILTDRQWTVRDLVSATLKFSGQIIFEERYFENHNGNSLFEKLIGMDRPSP